MAMTETAPYSAERVATRAILRSPHASDRRSRPSPRMVTDRPACFNHMPVEAPGQVPVEQGLPGNRSRLSRLGRLTGLESPRLVPAAGPVVLVILALGVDRKPDGELVADRLNVMIVKPRRNNEIARLRVDRAVVALNPPVDLALHDDPPLVMMMVVGVCWMARRIRDEERLHILIDHHRLGPRRLAVLRDDLVEAGGQPPDIE